MEKLARYQTFIDDFNRGVDFWLSELDQYSFDQITAKPSSTSWSIGQMIRHLIDDAHFYIEQITICTSSNDFVEEEASTDARSMFSNNEFPDELIPGSSNNAFIPQPESKEKLIEGLRGVQSAMNQAAALISKTHFRGKTKHPGLHYFSAEEWLQFGAMHLRHHIRQKKRIDAFLQFPK